MYTSNCIEESRIGSSVSGTDTNNVSHSHTCNDDDHDFDYQIYQWVVEKLFYNSDESITRDLKLYIE